MILIIEYNQRKRVVLFLGQTDTHFYCLASERIPDSIAERLKINISNLNDLRSKLDYVKDKYPSLYKIALRSFKLSSVKILQKYE